MLKQNAELNLGAITSDYFLDTLRYRSRRFAIWCIVLTVSMTGLLLLAKGNVILPLAVLISMGVFFAVVQYPRTIFFLALAGACLFETFPLDFKDSITDRVPYFWNINTVVQIYTGANFHGLPVSPFEFLLIFAGLSWLLRGIFFKEMTFSVGTLLVPVLFYVGSVVCGLANGLATGGEFNMALFEVRAQIYLLFAYLIGVNSTRDFEKHTRLLLWTTALAIAFKGILCTYRYYVTLGGQTVAETGIGSHEESFFFDSYVVLLLVLKLAGLEPKLRRVMLIFLPFVVIANLANMRRAATAAQAIALIPLLVLSYVAFAKSRRFIVGLSISLAVISAIYFPIFWNKDGMFAQPAHAIKSQFTPDARDASSNLYRDQENENLMITMKTSPVIGYGYGKPIIIVNGMVDLTNVDPFVHYMTHNQILWVWMRVGCLGFFWFWIMMMSFIIQGCQVARDPLADDRMRALAVFAVLVIIMLLVFGLLDLQISNIRDMLFCGMWIGTVAALRQKLLALEQEREPEPVYMRFDARGPAASPLAPAALAAERRIS